MSNCSQNCCVDWNSAVPCFKRLFHIGVWTFAWFVRPLLATILCIMENLVPACTCRPITYLAKKNITPPQKKKNKKKRKKRRHRTDFEADRWPETGDFSWPNSRPNYLTKAIWTELTEEEIFWGKVAMPSSIPSSRADVLTVIIPSKILYLWSAACHWPRPKVFISRAVAKGVPPIVTRIRRRWW